MNILYYRIASKKSVLGQVQGKKRYVRGKVGKEGVRIHWCSIPQRYQILERCVFSLHKGIIDSYTYIFFHVRIRYYNDIGWVTNGRSSTTNI